MRVSLSVSYISQFFEGIDLQNVVHIRFDVEFCHFLETEIPECFPTSPEDDVVWVMELMASTVLIASIVADPDIVPSLC